MSGLQSGDVGGNQWNAPFPDVLVLSADAYRDSHGFGPFKLVGQPSGLIRRRLFTIPSQTGIGSGRQDPSGQNCISSAPRASGGRRYYTLSGCEFIQQREMESIRPPTLARMGPALTGALEAQRPGDVLQD